MLIGLNKTKLLPSSRIVVSQTKFWKTARLVMDLNFVIIRSYQILGLMSGSIAHNVRL